MKMDENRYMYENANFVSKIFFGWCHRYFNQIISNGLDLSGLHVLTESMESAYLGDVLQKAWKKEQTTAAKHRKRPKLHRALTMAFERKDEFRFMMLGYFVLQVFLRTSQPVVLSYLVVKLYASSHAAKGKSNISNVLTAIILLMLRNCTMFVAEHLNFHFYLVGIKMTVAIKTLIYRKIQNLQSNQIDHELIMQMLTEDLKIFYKFPSHKQYNWLGFVIPIVLFSIIYSCLGSVVYVAIGHYVFMVIPLQILLKYVSKKKYSELVNMTQLKLKVLNEMILNIRMVKANQMEEVFEALLNHFRLKELRVIGHTFITKALFLMNETLFQHTAAFVLVQYYLLEYRLFTLDVFIFSLAVVLEAGLPMTKNIPNAVIDGIEFMKTLKTIESLLLIEEIVFDAHMKSDNNDVIISKVSVEESSMLKLNNLSLHIPAGKLCVISGNVNSGVVLIGPLLNGDVPMKDGEVMIGGEMAYYAKTPIVISGTFKDNIMMGKMYRRRSYKRAKKRTELGRDILLYEHKDDTNVNHTCLSLVQRAKIHLARVLYKEADIYLFDYPLICISNNFETVQILNKCIVNYLDKKTRIVVSNQELLIKNADIVFYIENGKLKKQGTYDEIIKAIPTFDDIVIPVQNTLMLPKKGRRLHFIPMDDSSVYLGTMNNTAMPFPQRISKYAFNEATVSYIDRSGVPVALIHIILFSIITNLIPLGIHMRIYQWSKVESRRNIGKQIFVKSQQFHLSKLNLTKNNFDVQATIYKATAETYCVGMVMLIVFLVLKMVYWFEIVKKISKALYTSALKSLLYTTLSVFDTKPAEMIRAAFLQRMLILDLHLPVHYIQSVETSIAMLLTLCFITFYRIYFGIVAIAFFFILIVYFYMFLKVSSIILFTKKTVNGLMYLQLTSTMTGLSTIKHDKLYMMKKYYYHQNLETAVEGLHLTLYTAFSLWASITSAACSTGIIAVHFFVERYVTVPVYSTGIVLLYIMSLRILTKIGFKCLSSMKWNIDSVKSIFKLTKITKEQELTDLKGDLTHKWPDGDIVIENLSQQIGDRLILDNISLTINKGQYVCIVGASGSGKSSLLMSLIKLHVCRGSIYIDNINTNLMAIATLRSRITYITEYSTPFNINVRFNLNPYGLYEDDELWEALDRVQLKSKITSLDMDCEELMTMQQDGVYILMYLAVAILKQNRILLLDDVTHTLNTRTVALVEKVIEDNFIGRVTVIRAHSLFRYAMKADRLIVLEKGAIQEDGTPLELLKNVEGYVHNAVNETDRKYDEYLKIAKKN